MQWLKERFVTISNSFLHPFQANRTPILISKHPVGLTYLILFLYGFALAFPTWAMNANDEDTLPCPPTFVRLHSPRLNSNGASYITLEINGEPTIVPLTAIGYLHSTPGSILDFSVLPNGTAWVQAVKNWANNSYAFPHKYHFVYQNRTYTLEDEDALRNAPHYPYNLEFSWQDATDRPVTLLSALPFFMREATRRELSKITYEVPHRASVLQTFPNNRTSFHYDGRILSNPEVREVFYECPAVREIIGLELNRRFPPEGTTTEILTTGREIECLALKTATLPEEEHFYPGLYQKRGGQETDSPFIYSNGQSLFLTRHLKMTCGIGINNGIEYIFEYILPTLHELNLKEGYRLLSHLESQPGFFPQGLYEWKNDEWFAVDQKFEPIEQNFYRIQSPLQNTTYFKDIIFHPSASNTQILRDSLHAPYLTVLHIPYKFFSDEEKEGLWFLLEKLTNLESLNLRGNTLTSLPDSFNRLTKLTYLALDNNKLTSLPQTFCDLTRLVSLNLEYNALTTLPLNFRNLTNLTKLYLEGNKLPPHFVECCYLTGLTSLKLKDDELTILPDEFYGLTGLTSLRLYCDKLTSLSAEFCKLTKLAKLDLFLSKEALLPVEFYSLTALTHLYLHHNELTVHPTEFCRLTGLTSINLCYTNLASLPDEFSNLMALRVLDLHANKLTGLPNGFGNLTRLERVNLRENDLVELPDGFCNLLRLEKLDLYDNKLTKLPNRFGNLKALRVLNLYGYELVELSDGFCNLIGLEDLDLSGNEEIALPNGFDKLTGLTSLSHCFNLLTKLPEGFERLIRLTVLRLDINQLVSLPEEFCNLLILRDLNLSSNQLKELPSKIGNLTALQVLRLSDNKLTELPKGFGNLTKLTVLDLDGNPLTSLPYGFEKLTGLGNLQDYWNLLISATDIFTSLENLLRGEETLSRGEGINYQEETEDVEEEEQNENL